MLHMNWMKSSYLNTVTISYTMKSENKPKNSDRKNRWLHFNNNVHLKMSSIENGFLQLLSLSFNSFIRTLEGCNGTSTLDIDSCIHTYTFQLPIKELYVLLVYLALKRRKSVSYNMWAVCRLWSVWETKMRWNRTMNYDFKSYIFRLIKCYLDGNIHIVNRTKWSKERERKFNSSYEYHRFGLTSTWEEEL